MKHADGFPTVQIVDHPLVQHKLSHMRDKNTSTRTFRMVLKEIGLLMGYELTRHLPMTTEPIETPLTTFDAPVIAGRKLAVVPILRAGTGMADGLLDLVPGARVGHVGSYRDPATKKPVEYMVKLPGAEGRTFIVVDPMLATGHSAAHAVSIVKRHGVAGRDIRFMALVAAPEGLTVFTEEHPDVEVYVAAIDSHLDANAYIVPGLGDAGDRLFGTK